MVNFYQNFLIMIDYGRNWTEAAFYLDNGSGAVWAAVTCDSSGQSVFAASTANAELDQSVDYGATFDSSIYDIPAPIYGIAASSGGYLIYASSYNSNQLFRATRGSNIVTTVMTPTIFRSIAVGENGLSFVAASESGYLYYSRTTPTYSSIVQSDGAPFANWTSIASSASGLYVTAGSKESGVYVSMNSGQSYTVTTLDISYSWLGVSMDSTGRLQVASPNGTTLQFSSDYGVTWNNGGFTTVTYPSGAPSSWSGSSLLPTTIPTVLTPAVPLNSSTLSLFWSAVSVDSTGQYLIAAVESGKIYYSNDFGMHFTESNSSASSWRRQH